MANQDQPSANDAMAAPIPLEEIMSELETIVGQLEDGALSLDDSLRLFERGVKLSRLGQEKIDHAEKRIEQLINGNTKDESRVPF